MSGTGESNSDSPIEQLFQAIGGTDSDEKVDLNVDRLLECGDCGPTMSRSTCAKCGGYAIPAPNTLLIARFKNQG